MAVSPVDNWIAQRIGVDVHNLDNEKVINYQLMRIRRMIDYIKDNSHYYKKILSDVNAENIKTPDDFKKLPVISEDELAGKEWEFQCIKSDAVSRIVTVPTSGTSGRHKRIAFSAEDIKLSMEFAPVGFAEMCPEGGKIFVMMSGDFEGSIGTMIKEGLRPYKKEVITGEGEDIKEAAKILLKINPDVVVASPRQLALLEGYYRENSIDFKIKSVLPSADYISDMLVQRLEHSWNADIFRHYGMTEFCMFGAVECHSGTGYHMRSADHYFEIIDEDENGIGEIAVTTFSHQAMPLLRYKTGDIGKLTHVRCGCTSRLSRIEKIYGRKSSVLKKADNNNRAFFLSDLEEIIFQDPDIVDFSYEETRNELIIDLKNIHAKKTGSKDIVKDLIKEHLSAKNKAIIINDENADFFTSRKNLKRRLIMGD